MYGGYLNPVAEVDGAGVVRSRFVYATRPHVPDYMVRDGRTYRLVSDMLGSVRLVVDVAAGQVAQRLDYDEFGRVLADTNPGFQPFGFGGGLHDPDTGLVRFGARDYDPETGRFTAPDPLLFRGGDTNLYNYALSDPVNLCDPLGLDPFGGERLWRQTDPEGFAQFHTPEMSKFQLKMVMGAITAKVAPEIAFFTLLASMDAARPADPKLRLNMIIVTPGGTSFNIPNTWMIHRAANGLWLVCQRPGSAGNASMVRIMYPTARYPHGYFRFYNQAGQLNPRGLPGPAAETHIPNNYIGPIPGWQRHVTGNP